MKNVMPKTDEEIVAMETLRESFNKLNDYVMSCSFLFQYEKKIAIPLLLEKLNKAIEALS